MPDGVRKRIRLLAAFDAGVVHRAVHGYSGDSAVAASRPRDAAMVKGMLGSASSASPPLTVPHSPERTVAPPLSDALKTDQGPW
jgi:hypothetical protein